MKEIAEKRFYKTAVVGAALPVVLDFYGTESKACEALAPRFAAVAEKFAGKVHFLKVQRLANAQLPTPRRHGELPTLVFLEGGGEGGAAERGGHQADGA